MHIDDIDEFPSEEELKKRFYHWDYLVSNRRQLRYWRRKHDHGKNRRHRNENYAKMYSELEDFWLDQDVEKKHAKMLKRQLSVLAFTVKFGRGRVTALKLKRLLKEEVKRRADLYEYENQDKRFMKKKKILCIVGESGAGKTLVSLHLKYKLGANVICSFTTRPPRETEVEGRDHHFIDIVPPKDQMLAFTVFGKYKYYALKSQVYGPLTVYVIDEDGLVDLIENHGNEYEIYSIYIKRRWGLKRRSGVDITRIQRDRCRTKIDLSFYNFVIENNSTKRELFNSVEEIYNNLLEKE